MYVVDPVPPVKVAVVASVLAVEPVTVRVGEGRLLTALAPKNPTLLIEPKKSTAAVRTYCMPTTTHPMKTKIA